VPSAVQVVIFGASGDLTYKKLVPALLGLLGSGKDAPRLQVVGVARTDQSDDAWRHQVAENIDPELRDAWTAHSASFHWCAGNASNAASLGALRERLDMLAKELRQPPDRIGRLFYLALAPSLFGTVVAGLAGQGLLTGSPDSREGWRRVVIEKPFGTDLASARRLNQELLAVVREDQVFRIDHFLGKETVQNILALRFQNAIFEPLWNRNHVESVEISVCETVAMEGRRGAYYDGAGALRDMVQNHLMQLLALVAMEPPGSLEAEAIRSEKVQVVRSLRRFSPAEVATEVVRGQYVAGPGSPRAYREEPEVARDSHAETYVAIRASVDNWRWSGVPFLLRTGKAMHERFTEIVLRFHTPPVDLLNGPSPSGVCVLRPNALRLLLQPEEGVRLTFLVKEPGPRMVMRASELGFDYADLGPTATMPAYQRLLMDAIEGQPTLFLRADEVEAAWTFVDAIRAGWDEEDPPLHLYSAGTRGPDAADDLFRGCEGVWTQG
jgi:glucose-6-phosphate 1-dehydrogenase